MSRAAAAFARMNRDVFAEFGELATVVRGSAPPKSVRVIITRGVEQAGEFGQVIGHVNTADFLASEWHPKQLDRLTWTDQQGTFTQTVSTEVSDDGHVVKVVLHG